MLAKAFAVCALTAYTAAFTTENVSKTDEFFGVETDFTAEDPLGDFKGCSTCTAKVLGAHALLAE